MFTKTPDKTDFVCPKCGTRGYVENGASTVITAAAEVGEQKELADYRRECEALVARTIERCAQVAETASYTPSTYINLGEIRQTITAAIRALKDEQ